MKILHVVRQYYPSVGGLENFVASLAMQQINGGHEIEVLTLDRSFAEPDKILAGYEVHEGVRIIRIPYFGSKRYPIAFQCLKLIKESSADIVHVHAIDFFFDFLALTKFIHKKTLVCSTHGGFFHTNSESKLKWFFFKTITRSSSKFFTKIFTCSLNDELLFRNITKNTKLIHNGVDTCYSEPSELSKEHHLITLGRLSTNKNVDLLIEVARELKDLDRSFVLHIVGPDWDNLVTQLSAKVKEYSLENYVLVHGKVSNEQLDQLVTQSSIYLSASSYEGFGLAVVEGMSAGAFPILSDIPSYREISEKAHLDSLTDYSDPKSVALKIVAVLDLPSEEKLKLRIKCHNAAKEYSWENTAKHFESSYKELIHA